MKQRLYVIYDVKAEAPVGFIQRVGTEAEILRMFQDIIAAGENLIAQHPEDFVLLFLGILDVTSLNIELNQLSRMVPVVSGADVARALSRARNMDVGSPAPNGVTGVVDPTQLEVLRR